MPSARDPNGPLSTGIIASYPRDAQHVVVRLAQPLDVSKDVDFSLAGGLVVREALLDDETLDRVVLTVDPMSPVPLVVDYVVMTVRGRPVVGPPFAHGPHTAMEVKVPNFEPRFPFSSRLAGVHVSVACCTGCDGGGPRPWARRCQ